MEIFFSTLFVWKTKGKIKMYLMCVYVCVYVLNYICVHIYNFIFYFLYVLKLYLSHTDLFPGL